MLWFFCDVFARPDDATGRVVTELARALAARMAPTAHAADHRQECRCHERTMRPRITLAADAAGGGMVGAVAVRPSGGVAGVRVRRVWATTFPKSRAWLLGLNWLTTTVGYVWAATRRLRRGDFVVVVSSPRLIPMWVLWMARWRGAKTILLVHDVYPEVFAAVGWLRREGWVYRALAAGYASGYRQADRIVVLGRDMERLVAARMGEVGPRIMATAHAAGGAAGGGEQTLKNESLTASATGGGGGRIVVIPNWGDVDGLRAMAKEASPVTARLGLHGKTVVGIGGTLGRTHDGALAIALAQTLRGDEAIRFLIYAGGVGREAVDAALGGAANVCLAPPCPPVELHDWLAAADVMLVPFRAGMAGISVPSRMYNIFAAGRPLLLTGDLDAEGARLVREHGVGWAVPAGDVAGAAEIIREVARNPEGVVERGRRARELAERDYTLGRHVAAWQALLAGVADEEGRISARR